MGGHHMRSWVGRHGASMASCRALAGARWSAGICYVSQGCQGIQVVARRRNGRPCSKRKQAAPKDLQHLSLPAPPSLTRGCRKCSTCHCSAPPCAASRCATSSGWGSTCRVRCMLPAECLSSCRAGHPSTGTAARPRSQARRPAGRATGSSRLKGRLWQLRRQLVAAGDADTAKCRPERLEGT